MKKSRSFLGFFFLDFCSGQKYPKNKSRFFYVHSKNGKKYPDKNPEKNPNIDLKKFPDYFSDFFRWM